MSATVDASVDVVPPLPARAAIVLFVGATLTIRLAQRVYLQRIIAWRRCLEPPEALAEFTTTCIVRHRNQTDPACIRVITRAALERRRRKRWIRRGWCGRRVRQVIVARHTYINVVVAGMVPVAIIFSTPAVVGCPVGPALAIGGALLPQLCLAAVRQEQSLLDVGALVGADQHQACPTRRAIVA
jgi:hypothetical protein